LKRRLIRIFGSVAGVRDADVSELSAVQGVSGGLAARIKERLQQRS
jgi:excinuclease UvrABC nuclease subunit